MLGALLTYQELSDYLRGVTSSLLEDDLPRLISTLRYYQDRLDALTPIIESLSAEPTFRRPSTWALRPKKRKKALTLDELRRREGTSFAAITALHTLLSPIQRLPPELLTEIFIHCLPPTQFLRPSDAESPQRLMRVCSKWWRICVSSPQLWTSLEIMLPGGKSSEPYCDEHHISAALFDIWLSRSGDLPFSLFIQNKLLLVPSIQRLLNICAHRLQHLKVLVLQKDQCMIPPNEYPRLTSLEIVSPYGLQHRSVNDLSTILTRTPSLKQLAWYSNFSPAFRPPPIMVHWLGLTHLTLHTTITIEHCLNILSLASTATHIDLNDIYGLIPTEPRPHITLTSLLSLTISSHHDISQVFDTLTLPHAVHLAITAHSCPYPAIVDIFRRSRFPLQRLSFFYARMPEVELMTCLELVQSTLIDFTVQTDNWPVVTDTLLDRLMMSPRCKVFCPHLEGIALYDSVACSPGHLAQMVRSRMLCEGQNVKEGGVVTPLRVVEVYSTDPELASLKPLRNLGLKLLAYSGTTPVDIDDDNTMGHTRVENIPAS